MTARLTLGSGGQPEPTTDPCSEIADAGAATVSAAAAPASAIELPRELATETPAPRPFGRRFATGGLPWVARGVTYGPFRPDADGAPFPDDAVVAADFASIAQLGANVLRVYHVPPDRVADAAAAHGQRLLVGVPWSQHLAFLDHAATRREIRQAVAWGVRQLRGHPARFAWAIGNEVPPDIVRWYGRVRVERFLRDLVATARDADPDGLVTYGNFPTTEYLDLPELDFLTFNVYLHDDYAFRRYLERLLNVAGERPLVIGEIGFDSVRQGEATQARWLARQLRLALDLGAAGVVAYSWTDEWHTGGAEIVDWQFGLVSRDRRSKPAFRAVQQVYRWSGPPAPVSAPRISVVICAYNAGATIEACLGSLRALRYPRFEVVVVDDGSTDTTGAVADAVAAEDSRFRVVHQPNRGLSVARNVGLHAATGGIVAYTDADCIVDPDWLAHLARTFQRTGAAAVGGLNIPEVGESRIAACIAAAPGWPTHVLVDDDVAEHVPGCNMAFRREALIAIGGFDPVYVTAGDDVDVCWKLLDRGQSIRFTSAAFVWHVARRSVRAYLRQQRGYGRAEGLLFPRHTHRFNGWRNPRWAGVIYHRGSPRTTWGREWVYHGPFGTAAYQMLYGTGSGGPWHLVTTLEWQLAAALLLAGGLLSLPLAALGAGGLGLSVARAVRFAARARLPRARDRWRSRVAVAGLAYLQPLVRGLASHRVLARAARRAAAQAPRGGLPGDASASGFRRRWAVWTDSGLHRLAVLEACLADLRRAAIPVNVPVPDDRRDVVVFFGPWVVAHIRSMEELHGGPKRLIRLDVAARPSGLGLAGLALLGTLTAAGAAEAGALGAAVPLAGLLTSAAALAVWTERASKALGRLLGDTFRRLDVVPVPRSRPARRC